MVVGEVFGRNENISLRGPLTSSWWYYDIKSLSALLALCERKPPVTEGWPVIQRFLFCNRFCFATDHVLFCNRSCRSSSHYWEYYPGPRLNIKTVFPKYGISMLKIRLSQDRLIFNMGIHMARRHLYIETAPGALSSCQFTWTHTEIGYL